MKHKRFTEEIDKYTVLILRISEFEQPSRILPEGFVFLSPEGYSLIRRQEKSLLRQVFDDWDIPYYGKIAGLRHDSRILVVSQDRLVGGLYVCEKNEFDNKKDRGQLHYAFMDPNFRGLGIYSVIFSEAVKRATAWGLEELYLNSDRYLLPEVYMRWGAKVYTVIEKSKRAPHWANKGWLFQQIRHLRKSMRKVLWIARDLVDGT